VVVTMKHAAPKTPGVLKLFVVVLLAGAVVSAILTASHLGASPRAIASNIVVYRTVWISTQRFRGSENGVRR